MGQVKEDELRQQIGQEFIKVEQNHSIDIVKKIKKTKSKAKKLEQKKR